MDIEGFVRGRLTKGEDEEELKSILAERIREFKDISDEHSLLMAESVIDEVKTTMELNNTEDEFLKDIITVPKANVGMGKMGVGSRGAGDFFVHRKIAQIVKDGCRFPWCRRLLCTQKDCTDCQKYKCPICSGSKCSR